MALPKLSASEYLRRVRPGEEVPNRVVNIHPVGDASWRASSSSERNSSRERERQR